MREVFYTFIARLRVDEGAIAVLGTGTHASRPEFHAACRTMWGFEPVDGLLTTPAQHMVILLLERSYFLLRPRQVSRTV